MATNNPEVTSGGGQEQAGGTQGPVLSPQVRLLLENLRWRIRGYVLLEGIAVLLIWLGLTFWVGLALDYLPVLVWASEIPWAARAVALLAVSLILAWLLYRWIVRRSFVRLSDRSMATLLERRFAEFDDSLMTTVELAEQQGLPFNSQMLSATVDQANLRAMSVRPGGVFAMGPLLKKLGVACLLIVPIVVFYAVNASAFATWVNRFYLLQERPWPRNARVEVAGIQVRQLAAGEREPRLSELIPFENGVAKVARGASVVLRVQADLEAKSVPEYCTAYYKTEDGSGQVTLNTNGRRRDGFQQYTFAGKPFKGVLSDISFDVVGYDHRVGNYRLEVVESPAVASTVLDCEFPEYMVDQANAAWTPREIAYLSSGTQLPKGTRVVVKLKTNKPLESAQIYDAETKETITVPPVAAEGDGAQEIRYEIARLMRSVALEISLRDRDSVSSQETHRVLLTAVDDRPPVVDLVYDGVGAQVTPDVIIPVTGTIVDDYAVAGRWFDVQLNKSEPFKHPFNSPGDAVSQSIDFRQLRNEEAGIELKPEDKFVISVKATDRYNLDGGPNEGQSAQREIEVVTPSELLAALERKELGQRRQLEHVLEEMQATRDSLGRIQQELDGTLDRGSDPSDKPAGSEPEDASSDTGSSDTGPAGAEPGDDQGNPAQAVERAQALRLLRVQQALLQSQKSSQETLSISSVFRDIVKELVNNRVDTEDRKKRLTEKVADPLQLIGETLFPELDRRLEEALKTVGTAEPRAEDVAAALEQTDAVLAELNVILQDMLDIETFNELVDIVRALVEEHEKIIAETKKQQKKSGLESIQ